MQQTRGLNRKHNSTLKGIFKGAATTIVTKLHADPLYEHCNRSRDQGPIGRSDGAAWPWNRHEIACFRNSNTDLPCDWQVLMVVQMRSHQRCPFDPRVP